MTNIAKLPCAGKYLEDIDSDFEIGKKVVIKGHILGPYGSDSVFTITEVKTDFLGSHVSMVDSQGKTWTSAIQYIRHATALEEKAKHRLTTDIEKYFDRTFEAQGEVS